jgi:hypothetical protein
MEDAMGYERMAVWVKEARTPGIWMANSDSMMLIFFMIYSVKD